MIAEPKPQHVVWLDGAFVPWSHATMHLSDHHYGIGVFEGVRSYSGKTGTSVFRLDEHTKRLLRSAHILRMKLPQYCDRETLNGVQLDLLRRNDLGDAYIRPFVFYGGLIGLSPRTRDLAVHVAVMTLAWKERPGSGAGAALPNGVSLRTSTLTRFHPNSLFSKAKTNGNYVNGILARQEAELAGADDALLLDQNGFVTETSGANVFLVRDGVVHTPPLASVLEGITRDTVMSLAFSLGFAVVERPLTRDEVYVADEVFLTGTASEITPVREVDGRAVGNSAPGPITEQLRASYRAHARGEDGHERRWLTRV